MANYYDKQVSSEISQLNKAQAQRAKYDSIIAGSKAIPGLNSTDKIIKTMKRRGYDVSKLSSKDSKSTTTTAAASNTKQTIPSLKNPIQQDQNALASQMQQDSQSDTSKWLNDWHNTGHAAVQNDAKSVSAALEQFKATQKAAPKGNSATASTAQPNTQPASADESDYRNNLAMASQKLATGGTAADVKSYLYQQNRDGKITGGNVTRIMNRLGIDAGGAQKTNATQDAAYSTGDTQKDKSYSDTQKFVGDYNSTGHQAVSNNLNTVQSDYLNWLKSNPVQQKTESKKIPSLKDSQKSIRQNTQEAKKVTSGPVYDKSVLKAKEMPKKGTDNYYYWVANRNIDASKMTDTQLAQRADRVKQAMTGEKTTGKTTSVSQQQDLNMQRQEQAKSSNLDSKIKSKQKQVDLQNSQLSGSGSTQRVSQNAVVHGGSSGNADPEKNLNTWLNPNYKMTANDKSNAKQYIDMFKKENPLYNAVYSGEGGRAIKAESNLSETQNQEFAKMKLLETKMSRMSALSSGFGSGIIPSLQEAGKSVADVGSDVFSNLSYLKDLKWGESNQNSNAYEDSVKRKNAQLHKNIQDTVDSADRSRITQEQQTQIQNPFSYGFGKLAGTAAEYALANKIGAATGITGAIENALPAANTVANPIGQKVLSALPNIVTGQAADTVVDTIPSLVRNYANGKYTGSNNQVNYGQIAKDAAINQGTNLAYNIGGEAIGQGIKALGNWNSAKKAAQQEYIQSIADALNGKTTLNNASDIAKQTYDTTKKVYQDTKGVEYDNLGNVLNQNNLKESIPQLKKNIPSENPESILFGNTVGNGSATQPNKTMAESTGLTPDTIPKLNSKPDTLTFNTNVSKFRSNTMQNSGISNPEELAKSYAPETYEYVTKPEKETMATAASTLANNYDGTLNRFTSDTAGSKGAYSSTDVDTAMMLYQDLNKRARQSMESGDTATATQLYTQARNVTKNLQKGITNNAQSMQALQKWTRTADGAIGTAEGIVGKNVDDALKENPKLATDVSDVVNDITNQIQQNRLWDQLSNAEPNQVDTVRKQVENIVTQAVRAKDRLKNIDDNGIKQITDEIMSGNQTADINNTMEMLSTGFSDISAEDMKKVQDIFDQAQDLPYNSKARVEQEQQAYAILANGMGVGRSFGDKINTWRYLAMLGNPRTHIKNMVGNTMFKGLNNVSDAVSTVGEALLNKVSGGNIDRTKSFMSGFSKSDKDLMDGAGEDMMNNAYRDLTGNKYYNAGTEIMNSGKAFTSKNKTLNTLMKPVQKLADINTKLLDSEDVIAMKGTFKKAEAGFLKANGADASIFKSTDPADIALLEKARAYAVDKAKYAAFHEDSKIANALSQFSNNMKESGIAGKALHVGIEATLPFKKTPLNILKSGIDYSPIGLTKGAIHTISAIRTGKYTASEAIDEISKGLTGTAMMGLGFELGKMGIIQASDSSDDRTKYYNQMLGKQDYSINFTGPDGKEYSYTISDFSPASLPLLVGAQISNMDGNNDIIDAVLQLGTPIIDTTMLSGLSDVLSSISSASMSGENQLVAGVQSAAINYAGQFVPTLLGQVARTVDPLRRSTYTGTTGRQKVLDKFEVKTENKMPGLSNQNYAYIDQWGREQYNTGGSNMAMRAVQNFVSPGYLQQKNPTELDKSLMALYDKTKDSHVYPESSNGKLGDIRMNAQEYNHFSKLSGQTKYTLASNLMKKDFYNNLSNDDKVKIIGEIYNVSNAYAGVKTVKGYINDSKALEIYSSTGESGLMNYMEQKYAAKAAGLSLTDKTQEIYNQSGAEGLKNYAESKAAAKQSDVKLTDKSQTIYNEKGQSGLDTYKKIQQAADPNGDGEISNKRAVQAVSNMPAQDQAYYLKKLIKKESKGAQSAQEKYGDMGLVRYYQYSVGADTNNNGKNSKAEAVKYLNAQKGMRNADRKAWFKLLCPHVSDKNNPY